MRSPGEARKSDWTPFHVYICIYIWCSLIVLESAVVEKGKKKDRSREGRVSIYNQNVH